jgi:hypothetical protein
MIEQGDFHWMSLGNCFQFGVEGPEDDFWFEQYEYSKEVAANVDDMCITCPVIKACASYGVEKKLDGVWGGIYLQSGKMSGPKNKHKSEETWQSLKSLLA